MRALILVALIVFSAHAQAFSPRAMTVAYVASQNVQAKQGQRLQYPEVKSQYGQVVNEYSKTKHVANGYNR
jgi:hypothetical protein